MSESRLEDRARAALRRIDRYPEALRLPPEQLARWYSALAMLNAAAAELASLTTKRKPRHLLADGAVGEALLSGCAGVALELLSETREQIGDLNLRGKWRQWAEYLASGDECGEEGQELLLALADRLEAEHGTSSQRDREPGGTARRQQGADDGQ